jgi:hypothetical protein
MGEEEEWREGVVHSLKRGREVWAQEGEEDVCRESEERGRRLSAEAGSTAQRSQILTSSTLGIKDLGPRTKDGLGQAGEERVMAGGRMGELESLSVGGERAVDIILRMANERKERK